MSDEQMSGFPTPAILTCASNLSYFYIKCGSGSIFEIWIKNRIYNVQNVNPIWIRIHNTGFDYGDKYVLSLSLSQQALKLKTCFLPLFPIFS